MITMPRFVKSTAGQAPQPRPPLASSRGSSAHAYSGNHRMGTLLAEIYRTGTLSEKSLASVTAEPQAFSQEELRRLINAISMSASRYVEQMNGGLVSALPCTTGGAIVRPLAVA